MDYDGVKFRLSTPDRKTLLRLSMNIRCWDELAHCGAQQVLEREYGAYLLPEAEPEYSVTLELDTEKVPAEGGKQLRDALAMTSLPHGRPAEARDALIKNVSLLKRVALGAPFELAFKNALALEAGQQPPNATELMQIHYRDEEAIYVQAASDRVTVVFSTVFREEADRIFGKVFLQEFVDARRQPSIQTAPQVLFSAKEPPLEIRSAPGLKNSDDIGYVTFGVSGALVASFADTDQSSSRAITTTPTCSTRQSRTSSCSVATFTTTSSAPRRTCAHACGTVLRSSRRSSIVRRPRSRRQRRRL